MINKYVYFKNMIFIKIYNINEQLLILVNKHYYTELNKLYTLNYWNELPSI